MPNDKFHPQCDCRSGSRTLVLITENLTENFPELTGLSAAENWFYFDEYGVVQIEIGNDKCWSSATEVFNFLRTIISEQNRLEKIRAVWLDSKQLLSQQLVQLALKAEPIANFADAAASELLDILQNRRIETWFQPVINARTETVWGYECLMRGRLANDSLVGAPQLLEWAQRENLTFMLDRVCREIHLENAGKLNAGSQCRFLINFLPTAIYKPEFCLQTSLAAARRSGLKPQQIIFEVVETEKIANHEHLLNILEFYRSSGFGVALDDLGSGYAGLTLLAHLQPDLIKIDREIVANSVRSKSHFNICASLVKMGKDNNQLVLAEGIETAEEKALMKSLGVDLYQGFYFGKPAPASNISTENIKADAKQPTLINS
jgi:EAL domain-containing protein (putative c-di-GMP-specific phosphodiesterase class I)